MSGYASKAGIKTGQTWGAAWAAVDTLLPFVSESITPNYDQLVSEALIGQASLEGMTLGTMMVPGDLVMDLAYGLTGPADIIAYAMGLRSTEEITLSNNLSANVFNLEIDKIQTRHRFSSCMVDKVTIAGKIGEGKPTKVTASLVCRSWTTTATAFPSISFSGEETRVFPEDIRNTNGHFYIGDLSDAMAVGDAMPIGDYEITIENGFVVDSKDSASIYVVQPGRNARRKITLKIGLQRYNSTTANFDTWKAAGTALQAELALEAASGSDVIFQFPHLKISDGANFPIGGPAMITGEVTLSAYYNGSVNAYMAVTDALEVNMTSF